MVASRSTAALQAADPREEVEGLAIVFDCTKRMLRKCYAHGELAFGEGLPLVGGEILPAG
jgi:hypothetical protein